jgi:hypothetical protein
MISNAEDLIEYLNHEFRRIGFAKVGDNWYLEYEDCIQVVNLQKSAYSEQYYLNLGILLKQLDETRHPNEYNCHIRIRLNMLGSLPGLQRIIDFEDTSIHPKDRTTRLSRIIKEVILPFLENMADLQNIKEALINEKYTNLIITLKAREFLERLMTD